jgi:hypothetical protein
MSTHPCKNVYVSKKGIFTSTSGRALCCIMLFPLFLSFGWNITWQLPSSEDKTTSASVASSKNIFRFFDDNYVSGGFPYIFPKKSKLIIDQDIFKNGEVSLRFDLDPNDYSGGSVCLYNMVYNIKPYLKKGALQFWIKGATGTEAAWIALVDDEKGDMKKTVVRLPAMLYGGISKEWSLMTIPLKDFGFSGVYWDIKTGLEINHEFDWDKVAEFRIEVKKKENKSFRVWADDIVIVKDLSLKSINH